MNLKDIGEFGLIEAIRKFTKRDHVPGRLSIGDDAAAIPFGEDKYCLVTTDICIEDVHFDLKYFNLYQVGWKTMAANLSDIAAMGGRPTFALVTLGLPKTLTGQDVEALYQGMCELADQYQVEIIGGDTSSSDKLVVSITLLGEVAKDRIVTRAGAKRLDAVCVTGELGKSEAGRKILREFMARGSGRHAESLPAFLKKQEDWDEIINSHLKPVPRLKEMEALLSQVVPHAMIDISDGLSSEIHHICRESGLGAYIYKERIPIHPNVEKVARLSGTDALEWALDAGEEFELLFTLRREEAENICREILLATGTEARVIGEIRAKSDGVCLVDSFKGTKTPLEPRGYKHF